MQKQLLNNFSIKCIFKNNTKHFTFYEVIKRKGNKCFSIVNSQNSIGVEMTLLLNLFLYEKL